MTITRHESTALALGDDQIEFTPQQAAALAHIGVEKASPGDLQVFFHVCKRSGLDPFARQIYMISRQVSERDASGNWHKVTKQTIQTGIDGFRLIGRRAADRLRHPVAVEAPEWAHQDGTWRRVWMKAWGLPVAARVTIRRAGEPFTAVALFDEYKQTKRDGELTQMWGQRPAGQIAKCAEALAWRMAFPQDLSGIYTDDEMAQADSAPTPEPRSSGLASVLDPSPAQGAPGEIQEPSEPSSKSRAEDDASAGEDSPYLNTRSGLAKRMFAAINAAGISDDDRLAEVSAIIGRTITTSKDMTEAEAEAVINTLEIRTDDALPIEGELVEESE